MEFPMVNASINLTKNCNLRCGYCFTKGKSVEVISLEMAKKSVDFLIKNAVDAKLSDLINNQRRVDLSFWGGEPLLEWDLLKEIVLYAESVKPKEVELQFGGTTNGTLLTTDKFDFLKEHNILLMVSLDGTEDSHDLYRKNCAGEGSHKLVVENLKEALKVWPFYKVRMSPVPERVGHFYEDVKYILELGVRNFYFSPVYDLEWKESDWQTFEDQCMKVVDLVAEYKERGIEISIEHFISYARGSDGNRWVCGAGRGYIGIDTDGSLWPCHRFIKFEDTRLWREKEWCLGHVEHGITKPEVRNKFIEFNVKGCDEECYKNTPCHGGCYGANFDLTGDIETPCKQICEYVKVQRKVSAYYKARVGVKEQENSKERCLCYNVCYLQNTKDEIVTINPNTDARCHCYNMSYSGSNAEGVATPISEEKRRNYIPVNRVTPQDVVNELRSMGEKFEKLENKLSILIDLLTPKQKKGKKK